MNFLPHGGGPVAGVASFARLVIARRIFPFGGAFPIQNIDVHIDRHEFRPRVILTVVIGDPP